MLQSDLEATRDELKKLKKELEGRPEESETFQVRKSLRSDHTFGERTLARLGSPNIGVHSYFLLNLKVKISYFIFH